MNSLTSMDLTRAEPAKAGGGLPQSVWLPGFWSPQTRAAALVACAAALARRDPATDDDAPTVAASVAVLTHALRLEGAEAGLLTTLAELRLVQGKGAEAASLLLDADIRSGGSRPLRKRLMEVLDLQGQRNSARRLARSWLLASPKTAQYWWHYATLADARADYALLRDLPDLTLSTDALTANLATTRRRALARLALASGLEDQAIADYRDLVADDLAALIAEGALTTRLKPPPKDDPLPFKFGASAEYVVSFVDPMSKTRGQFWQAIYECQRRGDWIGLATVLQSRRFEDPADTDMLRKLRALAQLQVNWAVPMAHQGYAGLLKAHFFMRQHKIPYWLDSGALLGALREGGAISWDSDTDLGVWDDQVPALLALIAPLAAQGIKMTPRAYRGHVYGFTIHLPRIKTIHIHVYFRSGETAVSPQMMCLYKPASEQASAPFKRHKWTHYIMYRVRSSGLAYRIGSRPARFIRRHIMRRCWIYLMALRNRLPREKWQRVYPFSAMFAIGTWAVPAKFFDDLTTLRIGGVKLSVPEDSEGYLTARYGDWRVPQQDWCYWTDDGCITPKTPEACGFGAIFDREAVTSMR